MPLKILYACSGDANNQNVWSGSVFHIRTALERAGLELEVFDRIQFECPLALRLLHQGYKRFSRKVHQLQIEPSVLKHAARRIERRFLDTGADAVFCPGAGVPINTFVDPRIPVFVYLDATKRSWVESYYGLDTLCARSRKLLDVVDRHGLENNTMTFFCTDWARQAALNETGVSPDRLAVVPFGANMLEPPGAAEVKAFIESRDSTTCRLLFLGKEWVRKGGPEGVLLLRGLREAGVAAEMDVIGCKPPIPADLQPWVHAHGFVDRSTVEGRAQFRKIISGSHLLLSFSKAEAYGLALCEANAFGVPCLATSVGGIPTIIRDGINGMLFSSPLQVKPCLERTLNLMRDFKAYQALARGARAEFDTRLNWTVAGARLHELIRARLGTAQP